MNSSMCRPSKAKVALSSSGLRGGAVTQSVSAIDCAAPRRLLVRFRASVEGSSALRERARIFLATNAPAREAKLAVRTLTGRLLAYADVSELGQGATVHGQGLYSRVRRVDPLSRARSSRCSPSLRWPVGRGAAEPRRHGSLDRTFTCAISPRGGLYLVDVRAHSGTRLQGKWAKLAYAGLRSGNFGLATGNMLAWVTSGSRRRRRPSSRTSRPST